MSELLSGCAFPSVHIVGSLAFKLPSTILWVVCASLGFGVLAWTELTPIVSSSKSTKKYLQFQIYVSESSKLSSITKLEELAALDDSFLVEFQRPSKIRSLELCTCCQCWAHMFPKQDHPESMGILLVVLLECKEDAHEMLGCSPAEPIICTL